MNIRDEVIDLFENVIEKSRRLGVAATPVILANELLASSVIRRIQAGALREVDPAATAILAAGFHRTEVPEPQDDVVTLTPEAVEANREYIERTTSEPQGEPSDAQVEAVASAIAEAWRNFQGFEATARAALRAAGGVR